MISHKNTTFFILLLERDFVDWEPSLTKKNRHHILVNERSHGMKNI
jgi:hypothetical protein